jgi:hypothetical protein
MKHDCAGDCRAVDWVCAFVAGGGVLEQCRGQAHGDRRRTRIPRRPAHRRDRFSDTRARLRRTTAALVGHADASVDLRRSDRAGVCVQLVGTDLSGRVVVGPDHHKGGSSPGRSRPLRHRSAPDLYRHSSRDLCHGCSEGDCAGAWRGRDHHAGHLDESKARRALASELGAEAYDGYRRRVPMLLPFGPRAA